MKRKFQIGSAALLVIAAVSFIASAAAQSPTAPAKPSIEPSPLEELSATRERPLFIPGRRPPSVKVEPNAPAPITEDETLPFQLTGTVLGPDYRVAILRQNGTPEELRLRVGETIKGWTIEEVGDQYVVVRGHGKRVRAWLFDETKKAGITVNGASVGAAHPGSNSRDDIDRDVVPKDTLPGQAPAPVRPMVPQRPRNPAAAAPNRLRPRQN